MIAFAGQVWRIMFADGAPMAPVSAPEGRFHHNGEWAVYCSLTEEGCGVAIRRYLRRSDPPRIIVPLTIKAERVVDLRGAGPAPSIVWQDLREAGQDAPTWALSDAARAEGAEAMLYHSRSRPDLTHLVVLDPGAMTAFGKSKPWVPQA